MAHRSHLQLRKTRERHLASRECELFATSWFTAFLEWRVKLLSHSEKRFAVETLKSGTLFGHFEVSYRDLLVALLINRHAVLMRLARRICLTRKLPLAAVVVVRGGITTTPDIYFNLEDMCGMPTR